MLHSEENLVARASWAPEGGNIQPPLGPANLLLMTEGNALHCCTAGHE